MNNKLVSTFSFLIGATVGSVATWKLIKTKYERMAQEEIDSVKEVFSKKNTALTNEVEKAHKYLEINIENAKKAESGLSSMVRDLGYASPLNMEEKKESMKKEGTYVIPPDDFGETGYKTESLTYYADKILTYETDEVIDDVDYLIGSESLNCFGEYEDDSVFVRNEDLKTDFEILLDMRKYSDVVSKNKRPFVEE